MIKITDYLNRKGYQFKRHGDELVGNCPFCGDTDRHFSVNADTGVWICNRQNNCGLSGNFYELQKQYGDTPERAFNSESSSRSFIGGKPKVYRIPKPAIKPAATAVMEYLKNVRKFTDETITHFKVSEADDHTAALPYYKDDTLVNVKYRDIIVKKNMRQEKDAEPCLFNRDNIFDERLVITEGEFDTMALYQYGIDAVSVPAGASNFDWVETEWDYLETFKEIILCFDGDHAGNEGKNKLVAKLGSWRCRNVTLPFKDANECLVNGVEQETINECFRLAEECRPAMLCFPSQFRAEIKSIYGDDKRFYGTPTPWEKLDYYLKGWREGEVTVWSGRNGSGKSTILNQVILDLAARGIRSCVASLEMPPARYLGWACTQYWEIEKPTSTQIDKALDYFDGNIYVINLADRITQEVLLEMYEYAARRYDCRHFIIDSLMKIKLFGKNDYEEQKEFVEALSFFAKKHRVHIHLVAHPRKGMSDDDKPGKVDVKGSSAITDLGDNLLMIWRTQEEERAAAVKKGKTIGDAMMMIKKNRQFGDEGYIRFYFNPVSKKFST